MFSANTSQVSNDVKYIEDFFSAWLRTGTGSSQTVTTGIKENTGALVISKSRSAATDWAWYATFRGATKDLASNTTASETTQSQGLTSFNTDGHTWGTLAKVNTNGATYVDFVLKPTPKFFDEVTWTGDGSSNRNIAHALGAAPGCVVVKRLDNVSPWSVWHRSITQQNSWALFLNATNAQSDQSVNIWGSPTTGTPNMNASTFSVGDFSWVNANGGTYVAYLFAHNAGGFGLTGTDNVISCGSFTTDGSGNATVNLGYEPQFLIDKRVDSTENWRVFDSMRGWTSGNGGQGLYPNLSNAETTNPSDSGSPTATGFTQKSRFANATYIYIAIRRGPMKTPTSGTSVYTGVTQAASTEYSVGFPADLIMAAVRSGNAINTSFGDRLRGKTQYLVSSSTATEATNSPYIFDFNTSQNGIIPGFSGSSSIYWNFRRAPGFFDEVCYTAGGSSAQTYNHNLGVAPELLIVKKRNVASTDGWWVGSQFGSTTMNQSLLNSTAAGNTVAYTSSSIFAGAPTSTTFTVGNYTDVGDSGSTYVAYLFASCPGVSKVGTYTGTGSTLTVNCGFTGGARFVMIKRIDSTGGNWFVYDTARGMVAGTDPALYLNNTGAESNANRVYTTTGGFQVVTSLATLNASGGIYLYLAIA